MQLVKYLVLNGILVVSLYFGFIEGVQGASNVAHLIGWFTAIVQLVYLSDKAVEMLLKVDMPVSKEVDALFDILVVCTFAYFGSIILAGLYLFGTILAYQAKEKADKLRQERLASEN